MQLKFSNLSIPPGDNIVIFQGTSFNNRTTYLGTDTVQETYVFIDLGKCVMELKSSVIFDVTIQPYTSGKFCNRKNNHLFDKI